MSNQKNNNQDNTIIMQDGEGNQIKTEILFSYEDEDSDKTYVYLVDYSDDTIIIGELQDDNSILILSPDTDQELKDKLTKVYDDYLNQVSRDDKDLDD